MRQVSDSLSGQAGLLVELLTAAMSPELERVGLTVSSFELLSAIQASGGKASQAEIAQRLNIRPPSLSEAVRYASQKGLVEQVGVEEDRRLKRLRLTTAGRRAVHEVLESVREAESEMVSECAPEEIAEAVQLLRRINRNLARRNQSRTHSTPSA